MAETLDKLLICTLQRIFRIDTIEATSIDKREEQIANLALQLIAVISSQLCLYLGNLFVYLIPNILLLLPIEACGCRLFANSKGLNHRWQRTWHTT